MNELPTHSRTFHPEDFALLEPEVGFFRNLRHDLRDVTVDLAHECRYWEYALALRVALRSGAKMALDAGGGAGLFAAGAAKCGLDVTHLEVGQFLPIIAAQGAVIGRSIYCVQSSLEEHRGGPYDLVACLSVIEHVGDDHVFFEAALALVEMGGVLVLTTDFHPGRERKCDGHLRTYNEASLYDLLERGRRLGFSPWHGLPDWSHFGHHVYDYTFASLVLRRE